MVGLPSTPATVRQVADTEPNAAKTIVPTCSRTRGTASDSNRHASTTALPHLQGRAPASAVTSNDPAMTSVRDHIREYNVQICSTRAITQVTRSKTMSDARIVRIGHAATETWTPTRRGGAILRHMLDDAEVEEDAAQMMNTPIRR